jgi:hypothetical protein
MVLDRSMLVLHSTTSSNEDKISKRDEIKTAVICSNGAPGNGPKQNYKPVEVASIDETKSSISGNETASSSNA